MNSFFKALLLAAVISLPVMQPAAAQNAWPNRAVRIIVPFAPGGTTDVVARLVGQKLGEAWNQTVVIENHAGAGGNVGADLVAHAQPDGYTLLMASGSIFTVNPHMYKKLPFDPDKNFIPVTNVATGPMLVVVNPKLPVRNIKDLVALAKAKPGSINFGSAGVGSQVQMAGESFAAAAGVDIVHVPYKGGGPALTDVMGNQIDMYFGGLSTALPHVRAGKLRGLGVTSAARSGVAPEIPAIADTIPGYEASIWYGVFAPPGTPAPLVAKLHDAIVAAIRAPDLHKRLVEQGMDPLSQSPAQFAAYIRDDIDKWARLAKSANIQPE